MAAVIHSLWEKGDRNRHIWLVGRLRSFGVDYLVRFGWRPGA